METEGPSVLRLVTSDLETTKTVLTSLGTEYRISEVLAVQMENRTGALAKVLERLAEEHINVEYAYVSATPRRARAWGSSTPRTPSGPRRSSANPPTTRPPARSAGRRPLHSR